MTSLTALWGNRNLDPRSVEKSLDQLGHTERMRAMWQLGRRGQARLFDAVAGRGQVTLDDLVPPAQPTGQPIVWHGINNLALFRSFKKPMYRSADGGRGGRNEQMWDWLVGPGFFSLPEAETPGEVWIDYVNLPTTAPEGWPRIRSNATGLSFFVFRGLRDLLRRVSTHVLVGKAFRNGRPLPNYFVLVRE